MKEWLLLIDLNNLKLHAEDNNGNLLSDGVNVYTYTAANRLKNITQGSSTSSFIYNGLGDRIKENDIQFVLDLNAGLTQALEDGTQTYLGATFIGGV